MINTGEEAEKTRSLRSRQDYEELLLELLRPLIPHFARCGARLELGASAAVYEKEAQWAEAFLRPLWGLVPLWAGGSRTGVFEEIYQKGLAAGTDRKALSIGEMFMMWTSGLWKWQLFPGGC